MNFRVLLTALCGLAPPALADEITLEDLVISKPYAYETSKVAMAGGGYLTIANTGSAPDRLIEVRAAYPKVGMHLSEERDGVMTMSPVSAIDIPAGETVELAPGGLHVMFMGLRGTPLVAGEGIDATLVFETSGEVDLQFAVLPRDAQAGHDQGAMSGQRMPANGSNALTE